MTFPRRAFLRLACGAAALPAAARLARAQAYPARPVHVIVGQAAGSSSDITARLIMSPNAPAEVAKFIAADTAKWVKVVQFAHLKVD